MEAIEGAAIGNERSAFSLEGREHRLILELWMRLRPRVSDTAIE
jgi:hypothetical protein